MGIVAFGAYDLLKCMLWMKRIVIRIERPEPLHPKVDEPVSTEEEYAHLEEEEDDLTELIKKVRSRTPPDSADRSSIPLGQYISELTRISAMSMDEFMKDVPEDNKKMLDGMYKIFESVTKGEKPDPEEMKKIREEMSEAFQQMFCAPITEEEKEEERKDSDIILHRLKEIHNLERGE